MTKTFKINPEICINQRTGISIFIITKAKNVQNRRILRNTWVKRARQKGICAYFLIGLDQSVQSKNKGESKKHQDLIQVNIIEDYSNLTLKSISMLRWAKVQCQQDQFIMKVEDNVIVDVEALLKYKNEFQQGMFSASLTMFVTKLTYFMV